jgi:hypothetical protein
MKYRWHKRGEDAYDERWILYLILDHPEGGGKKYAAVEVKWHGYMERWSVSGFVSEEKVHVEKKYEMLCDAKEDIMNYMKVWYVSGALQRMSADELESWHEADL